LSREEFAEGEGENRWTERLRGRPAGLGVSKPRGSPGEAAIGAGGGQEGFERRGKAGSALTRASR